MPILILTPVMSKKDKIELLQIKMFEIYKWNIYDDRSTLFRHYIKFSKEIKLYFIKIFTQMAIYCNSFSCRFCRGSVRMRGFRGKSSHEFREADKFMLN